MHKFGSTGILTGYIKQLLKSFNLPTLKIYTQEQADYAIAQNKQHKFTYAERYDVIESQVRSDETGNAICYIPYIKDNKLQLYVDGKWTDLGMSSNPPHSIYYSRGQHLLNRTKTFKIKDNVYDYYTHEYLGDYLRFLRDYDNLNLMPLYNCFSNHLCESLDFSFVDPQTGYKVYFNTADENYKIYMLPVRLFKSYTIAIDSPSPIELCCGVYNANIISEGELGKIPGKTYVKKNYTQFSQPFLYDSLISSLYPALTADNANTFFVQYKEQKQHLALAAQQEKDLKLFIKVPSTTKSSIVVLEGDYRSWNDFHASTAAPNISALLPRNQSTPLVLSQFLGQHSYNDYTITLFEYLSQKINPTSDEPSKELAAKYSSNVSPLVLENGEKYSNIYITGLDYEINSTTGTMKVNTTQETKYFKNAALTEEIKETEKVETLSAKLAKLNKLLTDLTFSPRNTTLAIAPLAILEKQYNHSIISNELILSGEEINLITPLQLLRLNTQTQIPFADRLIEYLFGNVIANTDDAIAENIELAQKIAQLHYLQATAKDGETAPAKQALIYRYSPQFFGLWDNSLRNIFYQYMLSKTTFETAHDILGYVDKDVEKLFVAEVKDSKTKVRQQTMINTDSWEA